MCHSFRQGVTNVEIILRGKIMFFVPERGKLVRPSAFLKGLMPKWAGLDVVQSSAADSIRQHLLSAALFGPSGPAARSRPRAEGCNLAPLVASPSARLQACRYANRLSHDLLVDLFCVSFRRSVRSAVTRSVRTERAAASPPRRPAPRVRKSARTAPSQAAPRTENRPNCAPTNPFNSEY